jgi:transposase
MFCRRKANKSGSTSVQLIEKRNGRSVVIATIGCAREESELLRLESLAQLEIERRRPQVSFDFDMSDLERKIIKALSSGSIRAVGPEIILGAIFDAIGFNVIDEPLFRAIVLARLTYPSSKLRTSEYMLWHQGVDIDVARIYRFLDRLHASYKERVEAIAFRYTRAVLGGLTVVFYDMTTLYFEAEDEDDLRKIGFSKDGKFQHPQIMLGLLVGVDGYPVAYDIYEGNTFEGKTLVPALRRIETRFGVKNPMVVADSGLLSKDNLTALTEAGYQFIIGARIKNEPTPVQNKILRKAAQLNDKECGVIDKEDKSRLIIDYSQSRAKKDAANREKGLERLKKSISSGKLTKSSINKRGYNKFLKLETKVQVHIDEELVKQDAQWDGLKGYVTNCKLPAYEVIATYRQLWKIERAFRISKTDLRIRPIYHRLRRRIEAHICIAFVAYTVFKELERLLIEHEIQISPARAIEIMKTIQQATVFLPESRRTVSTMLALTPEQEKLLALKPRFWVSQ